MSRPRLTARPPALGGLPTPAIALLAACAALAPALLPGVAQAQSRDPMQPPAVLRAPTAPGSAEGPPVLPESAQVLIADGKAYALIGSRRYAVGAHIGTGTATLTVERVNEHGVWLRSREGLHALPMVSGVTRKPSPETAAPDKSQEKRDRP